MTPLTDTEAYALARYGREVEPETLRESAERNQLIIKAIQKRMETKTK